MVGHPNHYLIIMSVLSMPRRGHHHKRSGAVSGDFDVGDFFTSPESTTSPIKTRRASDSHNIKPRLFMSEETKEDPFTFVPDAIIDLDSVYTPKPTEPRPSNRQSTAGTKMVEMIQEEEDERMNESVISSSSTTSLNSSHSLKPPVQIQKQGSADSVNNRPSISNLRGRARFHNFITEQTVLSNNLSTNYNLRKEYSPYKSPHTRSNSLSVESPSRRNHFNFKSVSYDLPPDFLKDYYGVDEVNHAKPISPESRQSVHEPLGGIGEPGPVLVKAETPQQAKDAKKSPERKRKRPLRLFNWFSHKK